MSKITRNTVSLTVSEFYENHQLKKYEYNPAYQRKSVWTEEKQAFLIDSLLRNYPIPPVFLHQKIDVSTGKTKFDVIDGKQRLMSIINFIEDKIYASSELTDEESDQNDGKLFSEIGDELQIKADFWRYRIPIELIDIEDPKILDNLFDRLNRNGEKLNGQELRKAKYYNTTLLELVNKIANEDVFWKERLEIATDLSRMEDQEFISELIFAINENKIYSSNQETIDAKYEEYKNMEAEDARRIYENFCAATSIMKSYNLTYDKYRIGGVSHLFGLWTLATHQLNSKLEKNCEIILDQFFSALRTVPISDPHVREYKTSMSSGTKMVTQRTRRRDALIAYLESNILA